MIARSELGLVITALIGTAVCTAASVAATKSDQWAYLVDETNAFTERSVIVGKPSGILGQAGLQVRFTCEKPFERDGINRDNRLTFSVHIPTAAEPEKLYDALAGITVYNEKGKFSTDLERKPDSENLVLMVRSFPAETYSDARDRRIFDVVESAESFFALAVTTKSEGFSLLIETAGFDEIAEKIQMDCRR